MLPTPASQPLSSVLSIQKFINRYTQTHFVQGRAETKSNLPPSSTTLSGPNALLHFQHVRWNTYRRRLVTRYGALNEEPSREEGGWRWFQQCTLYQIRFWTTSCWLLLKLTPLPAPSMIHPCFWSLSFDRWVGSSYSSCKWKSLLLQLTTNLPSSRAVRLEV